MGDVVGLPRRLRGVRNPPAVQETWVGSLDRGGRRQETGEPNLRSGPGQAPTGEQMGEVDCSELGWAKGKGAKERGGTYRQGTGWTAKACDQSSDPSLTTYWLWYLDSLLISLHFCFVVIFYLLNCVWPSVTPMDCSPPGPSAHGVFQARILEWGAISYSRGSSQLRDQTHLSCVSWIGGQVLYHSHHLGSPGYSLAFSKCTPSHETKCEGSQKECLLEL